MIEIQRVETLDGVLRVAALAQEIWREHYSAILEPSQIEYMLEKFQSESAIEKQRASGYEYYLACVDGEPAGYAAVLAEEGGVLFLSKLYVKKAFRGSGVGGALMSKAVPRGTKAIRLTVNKYNTNTISYYKSRGFKVDGEEKTDIGGGWFMDDYFMKKILQEKD